MSRIRSSLVLALCLAWTTALTCAGAATAPTMRCQRGHMPCCPMSGTNNAHCSVVRCEPQNFQKSEAPQANSAPVRTGGLLLPAARSTAPAPRELVSGLRHSFSVFRLKDDLRI